MNCTMWTCPEHAVILVITGCLNLHIHEYPYCDRHAMKRVTESYCETLDCGLLYEESGIVILKDVP